MEQVAFIESVAIQLIGLSNWVGGKTVTLVLGDGVRFDSVLSMGEYTPDVLLAFDTSVIQLSQITEVTVTIVDVLGDVLGGSLDVVGFSQIVLYLNGQEVFRGNRSDAEVDYWRTHFVFGG